MISPEDVKLYVAEGISMDVDRWHKYMHPDAAAFDSMLPDDRVQYVLDHWDKDFSQ